MLLPAPMRLVLAGLAAFGLVGCVLDEPSAEPQVDPRVRVLPYIEGIAVDPTGVRIPDGGAIGVEGLAPGDIIISAQGEGFLRQIDAVHTSGGITALTTHDANLGDALIDARVATALGGDGKADTYQLPRIGFSIRDKIVAQNRYFAVRLNNASLSLRPEIDLDLEIGDRRLQNFELVVRAHLEGTLDLQVEGRDLSAGTEITLWESTPSVFYQQIGIVPLVETVSTSVVLKVEGVARGDSRLRATANATADLEGGIRYTRAGGWDGVAELEADADAALPEARINLLSEAGVRAWLNVRLNVRLYGVAGPYVAVGPQLEVVKDFVENDFDAHAKFRGVVGGDLKIAGFTLNALPTFDLW
ncbi:MAG: hypothetical protein SFX73_38345 [Kofleriaceae bacterium]|nr:hypothetical protein [Kofleriaceae bacterium]